MIGPKKNVLSNQEIGSGVYLLDKGGRVLAGTRNP